MKINKRKFKYLKEIVSQNEIDRVVSDLSRIFKAGKFKKAIIEDSVFKTTGSGARVEINPDSDKNIGLVAYDDSDNELFKIIVAGTDVGDVVIGDYAGGQGIKYDKSAGTITYAGVSVEWVDVADAGGTKPDNNADVTGSNTSADTALVNAVDAAQVQPRAETLFQRFVFIGSADDGLTETTGANSTITRGLLSTRIRSYNTVGDTSCYLISQDFSDTSSNAITFNDSIEVIIFAKGGTKGGTTNAWDFSVGIGGSVVDANDTQRMFRFFSEDGVMSTQSADGTTQQETDVSAGLTLTNWNTYRIVFIAGTSVKFYINDVLKATHTTNIPSGTTQPTLVMGAASSASGGDTADYDVIISNGYSVFITQS